MLFARLWQASFPWAGAESCLPFAISAIDVVDSCGCRINKLRNKLPRDAILRLLTMDFTDQTLPAPRAGLFVFLAGGLELATAAPVDMTGTARFACLFLRIRLCRGRWRRSADDCAGNDHGGDNQKNYCSCLELRRDLHFRNLRTASRTAGRWQMSRSRTIERRAMILRQAMRKSGLLRLPAPSLIHFALLVMH